MTPPADRLSVRADLRLTVDGTDATVSGDGDRLVVTAEDPAALWDAVAGAVLPADVAGVGGVRSAGRAADALRAAGLRLEVRGPHGSVVQLGSGVRSGVGRVVAGSSAVSPGSARTVAPLVVHRVRQDPRSRAAIAVALAAVAVRSLNLTSDLETFALYRELHQLIRPSLPCHRPHRIPTSPPLRPWRQTLTTWVA